MECHKKLSEYYKININNIAAFGDDVNDIEMIKKCGIGIAVENAIEEVKNNADYICGNNENNGMAHWIEQNIL
jgi:hydroxymethylpyrimidine pyrophosphatase-like HAD family hydrolase